MSDMLKRWQERAWKAENEVTELTQTNIKLVGKWEEAEAKLAAVERLIVSIQNENSEPPELVNNDSIAVYCYEALEALK
jgi:hypothetical protein